MLLPGQTLLIKSCNIQVESTIESGIESIPAMASADHSNLYKYNSNQGQQRRNERRIQQQGSIELDI